MPSPRTSRPNKPGKKTGIELKAQRMVSKLRHYHEQGGLADPSDRKATVALAEADAVGVFTMHKARAFARPVHVARIGRPVQAPASQRTAAALGLRTISFDGAVVVSFREGCAIELAM